MTSPGTKVQDAATLLARASGSLQGMASRRRISRANVSEALAFAERAANALRLVLDQTSLPGAEHARAGTDQPAVSVGEKQHRRPGLPDLRGGDPATHSKEHAA